MKVNKHIEQALRGLKISRGKTISKIKNMRSKGKSLKYRKVLHIKLKKITYKIEVLEGLIWSRFKRLIREVFMKTKNNFLCPVCNNFKVRGVFVPYFMNTKNCTEIKICLKCSKQFTKSKYKSLKGFLRG